MRRGIRGVLSASHSRRGSGRRGVGPDGPLHRHRRSDGRSHVRPRRAGMSPRIRRGHSLRRRRQGRCRNHRLQMFRRCVRPSPHCDPGELADDDAWTEVGPCTGTVGPTSSPTFDPDTPGCPDPYSPAIAYGKGDKVAVDGSRAYMCKRDDDAAFCNAGPRYAPGTGLYSDVAWVWLGSCVGTLAPTAAPTVDLEAPGCPEEYSSAAKYEGGDKVLVGGLVYVCKWDEYGAYCNAGPMFAPGGDNSDLGWIKMGSCRGSLAPVASPL
mmetsp:Transcript_22256/g.44750  ORF Transcript_22256/g.44750 Transcript_22256/m.44750 type:complete len:267 (-) Transcript_22256:291-1091(-)